MILVFKDPPPEIVISWTLLVSLLAIVLIAVSYYLGFRSGRKRSSGNVESRWSRGEVIGIAGVVVMIMGVVLSLFNPEVCRLLGF